MPCEINVSQHGKHLFATHARSITSEAQAKSLYVLLLARFPASGGFEVSVSECDGIWRTPKWLTDGFSIETPADPSTVGPPVCAICGEREPQHAAFSKFWHSVDCADHPSNDRHAVKQRAYQIDPACWVSYSGQPVALKRAMDKRRTNALENARLQLRAEGRS